MTVINFQNEKLIMRLAKARVMETAFFQELSIMYLLKRKPNIAEAGGTVSAISLSL
jgi:hypothetical protein